MSDTRAFIVTGMMAGAGLNTIPLPGDSPTMKNWRSFAVPWIDNDIHEQIKTMDGPTFGRIFRASLGPNLTPRWNGSIFYPAKIPDLVALKGQKYIDHTGTWNLPRIQTNSIGKRRPVRRFSTGSAARATPHRITPAER